MPITKVTRPPTGQPAAPTLADQLRAGVTSPAVRTALGDLAGVYDGLTAAGVRIPTVLAAGFEAVRQAVRLTTSMTVRVRNQAAETPWGSGPTSPVVTTVTIPAVCPRCGGPRGEARTLRQHEDGTTYFVDVWDNPCGHVDLYEDVVREAARYRELVQAVSR